MSVSNWFYVLVKGETGSGSVFGWGSHLCHLLFRPVKWIICLCVRVPRVARMVFRVPSTPFGGGGGIPNLWEEFFKPYINGSICESQLKILITVG